MTLSLGINAAYHESAAALVKDGELVLAVEEERFSRVKHAKPARVDNADALPWAAIDACLEAAGVELSEVDHLGYALMPRRRLERFGIDDYPLSDPQGWGSEAGEREFCRRVRAVPALLAERAGDAALSERVEFLPHHLAHAASAYHGGPFARAALLVIDGIGEESSAWLGCGEAGRLDRIEQIPYPHSIGLIWERLALYLGLGEYDAGKAMGLAAFGDPARYARSLDALFRVPDPDGGSAGGALPFWVDAQLARFRGDLSGWERLFGPARRGDEPILGDARFADLAAAVQARTEEAVLATCRRLQRAAGEEALAYAGGVALNCVANALIEREGPFDALYVVGPAHDAGTALGAALELDRRAQLSVKGWVGGISVEPASLTALLGPAYDDRAIDAAIAAAGLRAEIVGAPERVAAEMIAEGMIVGWFQGRLELGPRALGNRSLLADPRRCESRESLNRRIKHREPFRPFAASCLLEALADYFVLPHRTPGAASSRDLMVIAYPVRPERQEEIAAVVHRDGTCRIQTVDAVDQPRYHALIRCFEALTGVPVVLNTSFNDQEPIVCTPAHALETFRRVDIDAVLLGDRLVRKS